MYFKLVVLFLLWSEWTNLCILLLLVNMTVNRFHSKIFSLFCSNLTEDYNKLAESFKIELFKGLNDMKPGEKISVLEVGAGPGANFKYYNREMSIQIVEPNVCFEAAFNSNRAKYPELDIQDMKDQQKCLREIKRVLKPGGKFFYMEHIIDDTDALLKVVQQILTTIGFWQWAFAGCCIDRSTAETIEAAGFTRVDQKKYDLPNADISFHFKIIRSFVKRHVMGVAEK